MSIRRAPRPDSNFYMLDKRISEDPRLSWAARGLLIFLLGKPDHWEVSVQHLVNQTADAIGKSSKRDAVYGIMRELSDAGYLIRQRGRQEGGEFSKVDYIVTETPAANSPQTDSPHTENPEVVDSPDTDKPYTVKPDTVKPTQVSTEVLVSTENSPSTDEKQVAAGASPSAQPDEVELDDEPRIAIPADMPGPKNPKARTFKPWANYAITYRRRYGVWPIWNARNAGQLAQLVDRVGKDLAPGVAAHYLTMNNQYYVSKGHPIGLLIQDCETIATSMQTGQQMTATRARQMDGTQANLSAADEAKALLNATWGD